MLLARTCLGFGLHHKRLSIRDAKRQVDFTLSLLAVARDGTAGRSLLRLVRGEAIARFLRRRRHGLHPPPPAATRAPRLALGDGDVRQKYNSRGEPNPGSEHRRGLEEEVVWGAGLGVVEAVREHSQNEDEEYDWVGEEGEELVQCALVRLVGRHGRQEETITRHIPPVTSATA